MASVHGEFMSRIVYDWFLDIEQVIVHGTLLPIMDMGEVLVLMFSKYAMEE